MEYVGPDGTTYESEFDELWQGEIGFCGCGRSEATAEWMADALDAIDALTNHGEEGWDAFYADWKDRIRALHGNEDGSRYFFWYWCDKEGLTDHGGAVPGWLTDKGKELRDRLRELARKEAQP